MDSLEIDGKTYVSARKAAKEHGYVADYIGQLIRAGKLVGKKVGRAWYVDAESLDAYIRTSYVKSSQFGTLEERAVAEIGQSTVSEVERSAATATEPLAEVVQETAEHGQVEQETSASQALSYELLRYMPAEEPALPDLGVGESIVPLRTLQADSDGSEGRSPSQRAASDAFPQELATVEEDAMAADKDQYPRILGVEPMAPSRARGGSLFAALSFAFSVLIALSGLAIGAASLIAVREVEFAGSSVSASIEGVREFYLDKTR